MQYLDNYRDTLSTILPLTNQFILFSATHFFTCKNLLSEIVVKQLNYLPKEYYLYFINLDMSGLMPERYYRFVFKITSGIYDEFIEDDFYFKIVR